MRIAHDIRLASKDSLAWGSLDSRKHTLGESSTPLLFIRKWTTLCCHLGVFAKIH